MRLIDAATGNGVVAGRRGGSALRVRVVVSGAGPDSLDTVRVLLTGDLVRRILEDLHGLQVFVTLTGLDRDDPPTRRHLDHQLDRFWIAPPEPDTAEPARAVELGVSGAGDATDLHALARLAVGPVHAPSRAMATETDPLVVRFALITARYDRPLPLTAPTLNQAQATLQRVATPRRRVG